MEFINIPPVKDYDFYMQMFGGDNRIQVGQLNTAFFNLII